MSNNPNQQDPKDAKIKELEEKVARLQIFSFFAAVLVVILVVRLPLSSWYYFSSPPATRPNTAVQQPAAQTSPAAQPATVKEEEDPIVTRLKAMIKNKPSIKAEQPQSKTKGEAE